MKADLPGRALQLVLVAFASTTLLHLDRLPLWCVAAAIIAVIWRLAHGFGRLELPGRMLRLSLVLSLTVLTLASYRTLGGLAGASALLTAMGAAKLLETRLRRDALVVVLTSFILLLAACLDRQSLLRLPLYLLCMWISCAAIAALGDMRTESTLRRSFVAAGGSLLWGLPLAVLLFLFVPRLPGALWSLPATEQAQTGLSDQMSPGSISELALSDALAFRVSFRGTPPPAAERYWRGPVLHNFDGYTWSRGPRYGVILDAEPLGEPVEYEVMLEASNRNWWFGLDSVTRVSRPGVFITFDGQVVSNRAVTATTAYQATSHLRLRTAGPLPITTRRLDTLLPPDRNPRTLRLARQMRADAADDSAFVTAALQYFREGGFRYTLTPPLLDYDSVDDLLFNTRLGFCGHFASAFVTMMRAAGVPARVVTGYQGGEWNRVGGFLVVRQSDAHAWAEVWLNGSGWQRVDPTAVVSPARLQRSLDDVLPGRRNLVEQLAHDNSLLRNLTALWDASSLWWQQRVINFNQAMQQDLLRRLGLDSVDWKGLVWLLSGGMILWAVIAGFWISRTAWTRPVDDIGTTWLRFRNLLQLRGLSIAGSDPPGAIAHRAGAAWPAAAAAVADFVQDYLRLRYGPSPQDAVIATRALHRQLRRVRRDIGRRRPVDSFADLDGPVPLFSRLPANLRPRVALLAAQMLRRVRFEGCKGLVLTPFMRRAIAFQACVPILNRGAALYAGLRSVLVYPEEFVVRQESVDDDGIVTRGTDVLSGQTEDNSRVLLSWADIEHGMNGASGYNVVLHEFAHIIDHALDGRLTRRDRDADADWHDAMQAEFDALCALVDSGEPTLIDPYGAEDPQEFFAVCTETFFERAGDLARCHPRLYAALSRLYRLDPAAWPG